MAFAAPPTQQAAGAAEAAYPANGRREISERHAHTKQAERGKRGARERVLALLDEGSFLELDPFVRHRAAQFGMEQGRRFGTVDGRRVAVFS